MNMKDVKEITIPEGSVKQIQDSNGNIIWGSQAAFPYRRLEYLHFNGTDNFIYSGVGNKNGYYFTSNKDDKFTLKDMPNDFKENPNLYKIMHDNIMPILEQNLSGITPEEIEVPQEELNFYDL